MTSVLEAIKDLRPRAVQVGILFVLLAGNLQAQAGSTGRRRASSVQGYGVVGPSFRKGTNLEAGLGGKADLWNGVGAGAEIAGLAGDLVAAKILSANLFYELLSTRSPRRTVPFGTFGYSRISGDIILEGVDGVKNFVNFGAGINYWLRDHVGLVLEIRDYMWSRDTATHLAGFRAGFSFRKAPLVDNEAGN